MGNGGDELLRKDAVIVRKFSVGIDSFAYLCQLFFKK